MAKIDLKVGDIVKLRNIENVGLSRNMIVHKIPLLTPPGNDYWHFEDQETGRNFYFDSDVVIEMITSV